jgi:3-phosphoshikimate 1-carboxyvinyltransferase
MAVPGGQTLKGGVVDARGDHRLAMTAAVAGTLADGPVEIHGFEAVATSYPGFLDDLLQLGGEVER